MLAFQPPTIRLMVLATVSFSLMLTAEDASRPAPPATPEHDVVENYHGRKVRDPYAELALTSTQRSNPQIVANVLFYMRQTPPQPQAVLVAEAWPNGESKVIVDTNATQGDTAITKYWPSPDGKIWRGRRDSNSRPLP